MGHKKPTYEKDSHTPDMSQQFLKGASVTITDQDIEGTVVKVENDATRVVEHTDEYGDTVERMYNVSQLSGSTLETLEAA